jgi:hypothetical protein
VLTSWLGGGSVVVVARVSGTHFESGRLQAQATLKGSGGEPSGAKNWMDVMLK